MYQPDTKLECTVQTNTTTPGYFDHPEVARNLELMLSKSQNLRVLEYCGTESKMEPGLLNCMQISKDNTQSIHAIWRRLDYTYAHTSEDYLLQVVARFKDENLSFDTAALLIGQNNLPPELHGKQFDAIVIARSALAANSDVIGHLFRPILKSEGMFIVQGTSASGTTMEPGSTIGNSTSGFDNTHSIGLKQLAESSELWERHSYLGGSCEFLTTSEKSAATDDGNLDSFIISDILDIAEALQHQPEGIADNNSPIIDFDQALPHDEQRKCHFMLFDRMFHPVKDESSKNIMA